MATRWEEDQAETRLGIIEGESNEDYHKSPGLSASGLKIFAKSAANYLIAKNDPEKKETGSQRLGTICHMAVLEPARFREKVLAVPGHRGANATKEAIAMAEAMGKIVCKPDEYESATLIAARISLTKTASALLSNGRAEVSVRWRDPATGVLLKCRPDFLRDDGKVVDVKTFDDLTPNALVRQIIRMKYNWQSQFYLTGVNHVLGNNTTDFIHLFVDPDTGLCQPVVLRDASLDQAEFEIRPLIEAYAECLKKDIWPGPPDGILNLDVI